MGDSLTKEEGDHTWSVVDRALKRYVSVWLWTLLFGTASGIAYAFVGVDFDRPWGPLAMPLAILVGLGIASAAGAWVALYSYLVRVLLPMLHGGAAQTDSDDPHFNARAAYSLRMAFMYIMMAGFVRLSISLVQVLFSRLR